MRDTATSITAMSITHTSIRAMSTMAMSTRRMSTLTGPNVDVVMTMGTSTATSITPTSHMATTIRTITPKGMITATRMPTMSPAMSTAPAAGTTTRMAEPPGRSRPDLSLAPSVQHAPGPGEDGGEAPGSHAGLIALFAWLSPSFPIGAYAYSHALEWAVEGGDVRDEASLAAQVADLMRLGFGRSDGILLAHAWRAAVDEDAAALCAVNALAVCLAPSAELRLETCQQGRSFLEAVRAAWPAPTLEALAGALSGEVAYPVAVGLAAGAHRIALAPTLEAFLLAVVQALVSAAIRLAPIGQTAGTRVVAGLAPAVRALARDIPALTLDDLGTATFRADLGSFRHETQYTRLFRS